MCMPTHGDVVGFFKTLEGPFLVYLFVVALCLVNSARCLEWKIKFLNRMLKTHRLDGQVKTTPQAVQRFKQDKWILFFLILIVILLIQVL